MDKDKSAVTDSQDTKPKYETPKVKIMDEEAILTAFQVRTFAPTAWWAC